MERALVCRPVRRFSRLALALGLAAAPVACGDDDDDGTGPSNQQPPLQAAINIADFAFAPRVDTVRVGGTVTWTNSGAAPHTSTSTAAPPIWDSGSLSTGESFSRDFGTAGSFPYFCSIHPGMTGTIVAR